MRTCSFDASESLRTKNTHCIIILYNLNSSLHEYQYRKINILAHAGENQFWPNEHWITNVPEIAI